MFCSEAKIRELNRDWRGKSKSTDVLSFPANRVSTVLFFTGFYTIGIDHSNFCISRACVKRTAAVLLMLLLIVSLELSFVYTFLHAQFSAPEVFDAESRAAFKHFGQHLGDIAIAPVYVKRQCDSDREDCEVCSVHCVVLCSDSWCVVVFVVCK